MVTGFRNCSTQRFILKIRKIALKYQSASLLIIVGKSNIFSKSMRSEGSPL